MIYQFKQVYMKEAQITIYDSSFLSILNHTQHKSSFNGDTLDLWRSQKYVQGD